MFETFHNVCCSQIYFGDQAIYVPLCQVCLQLIWWKYATSSDQTTSLQRQPIPKYFHLLCALLDKKTVFRKLFLSFSLKSLKCVHIITSTFQLLNRFHSNKHIVDKSEAKLLLMEESGLAEWSSKEIPFSLQD